MNADPAGFRSFELSGWQRVTTEYDRGFGGLTTQSIAPLLDAAAAGRGTRVLDVACGPGYATSAAAGRGADTLGIDFSSEMIGLAKARYPGLRFEEGDAERLHLPDRTFDAVVMNFGMLHLGDPDRAIAEAFRVLKPGGRYAFTVWDRPEIAAGFNIVLGALQEFGDMSVPLPPGPPFFRFSDPQECARTLEFAGFLEAETIQVPQVWRLESGETLFTNFKDGAVRTAALLRAQSPDALAAIREAIVARAEKFRKGAVVELPMPAILTFASRPKD